MTDDDILRARARALARRVRETETAQTGDAIRVEIAEQQYAFAIADIARAIVIERITPLPNTPPILLGLVADRGETVPVFDARIWLGKPPRARTERTPVLVLGTGARMLGLAVDALLDSIVVEAVQHPAGHVQTWLRGITSAGVLVVDVPSVLGAPVFTLATEEGRA